jgi:YegS/Rv2252/BmrU family lipid kinase
MRSRAGAHRPAALIVNARARRGEDDAAQARQLLQAQGVAVGAAYALRSPARLPETVRTALGQGYDLIILGGGDGTISAVVDDLAHHHAVLGVLPLGTANDFARTLGIPTNLAAACATIAHGTVVDIDLGLADDNYYVNVASIGLGAATIKAISPRLKRVVGTLAYPLATTHAFLGFEAFAATLTFPGGDHSPVTLPRLLQIAVGNGRFYGGGMAVAPQAGMDDGTLDVYAIEWGNWRDLLGVLRSFKSGHFVQHETVHYYQTACLRIDTARTLPTNVDGELVDQTPVLFSLARDALQVIVPQGAPGVD